MAFRSYELGWVNGLKKQEKNKQNHARDAQQPGNQVFTHDVLQVKKSGARATG